MKRIEHLGIAVKSIALASRVYRDLIGEGPYKEETVESEAVNTAFFRIGESKIELLEALRDDSPVAKFIESRGEGLHHVALEVVDLDAELIRLAKLGYRLVPGFPKDGADNKRVAFLHPKDTAGLLIELCQEKVH